MEKMNLSQDKVFGFVKEAFTLIGYPENIEIYGYVGDGDKPVFYANYERNIDGEVQKHIKPLPVKDFVSLMQFAMLINGYDIEGIDIRVRDEEICYSVRTNIASYDSRGKNKRRR